MHVKVEGEIGVGAVTEKSHTLPLLVANKTDFGSRLSKNGLKVCFDEIIKTLVIFGDPMSYAKNPTCKINSRVVFCLYDYVNCNQFAMTYTRKKPNRCWGGGGGLKTENRSMELTLVTFQFLLTLIFLGCVVPVKRNLKELTKSSLIKLFSNFHFFTEFGRPLIRRVLNLASFGLS